MITVDSSYSSELPDILSRAPETVPVYLKPDEPLKLRVFIDKSFAASYQRVARARGARWKSGDTTVGE